MNAEDSRQAVQGVKRRLINAHDEISGVADFMELRLTIEYDRTMSKEYGKVHQTLGILEEQIATIRNQITKLKK